MRIASDWAKEGLSDTLTEKYLEMYVNEDSLHFSSDVRRGLQTLYTAGHRHGICPEVDLSQSIREDRA